MGSTESKDICILLNNNNNDYLARWEWKSNKEPWNFNEPAEWTAYTNEKSNMIHQWEIKYNPVMCNQTQSTNEKKI